MTIGQNIKRLRERAGMSQSELARAIDVTRSLISQYEADIAAPRMGNVERLAMALGCTKSEIIEDVRYATVMLDDLPADEHELLDLFRAMDKRARADLLKIARSLSASKSDMSERQAV